MPRSSAVGVCMNNPDHTERLPKGGIWGGGLTYNWAEWTDDMVLVLNSLVVYVARRHQTTTIIIICIYLAYCTCICVVRKGASKKR
jgi:hypothetical protein